MKIVKKVALQLCSYKSFLDLSGPAKSPGSEFHSKRATEKNQSNSMYGYYKKKKTKHFYIKNKNCNPISSKEIK